MRAPTRRRADGWWRELVSACAIGAAILGSAPPAEAQSEQVEYYALDALGSVRVVFDANGTILGRMDYGPFGEELSGATGLPDRRFAGLFRDGEAGLDAAGARSYQVRTGRFSSVDSVYAGIFEPQRWNRYSYAFNSPVVFIDPEGREGRDGKKDPSLCTPAILKINPHDWHCTAISPPPWSAFPTINPNPTTQPVIRSQYKRELERPGRGTGQARSRRQLLTPEQSAQRPDYDGFTIVVGVEASAVAVTGSDVSTGVMIGASGCPDGGVAAGGFGSMGAKVGLNVSAGAFVGYVRGPVGNVGGVTTSVTVVVLGFVNISVIFDQNTILGGTVGAGLGPPAPVVASAGVTGTGLATVGACR